MQCVSVLTTCALVVFVELALLGLDSADNSKFIASSVITNK